MGDDIMYWAERGHNGVDYDDRVVKTKVQYTNGRISGFVYLSTTNKDVEAHQGVAFDGTYFYTTAGNDNLHLYKWDSDWNLIASRDTSSDAPTDKTQINSIFYKDGKLYIGANNYSNTPKKGWIVVYDADDLTPIEYHVLDHWSEGCAWHNNEWWVVYDDYKYVSRYDADWNHIADYELTYSISGVHYYQGIRWIGDYIYVNIHGGSSPETLDCYHWTGNGFEEVARLDRPTAHCTQGIHFQAGRTPTVLTLTVTPI